MENQKKKSLKWLWITIALVVVAAVGAWVIYNGATGEKGVSGVFSISTLLASLFLIAALGYMLGRITIKGVSLGTAGVFLVAILFGFLCTLIPSDWAILGAFHLQGEIKDTAGKEPSNLPNMYLPSSP